MYNLSAFKNTKLDVIVIKARIIKKDDQFYLLLFTGEIKQLTKEEVIEFMESYEDSSHYSVNHSTERSASIEECDGETVAYVTHNNELIFPNSDTYRMFNRNQTYLTAEEYAAKHGKAKSLILRFCTAGRIEGAYQRSKVWLIPEDAPYPAKQRNTSLRRAQND